MSGRIGKNNRHLGGPMKQQNPALATKCLIKTCKLISKLQSLKKFSIKPIQNQDQGKETALSTLS